MNPQENSEDTNKSSNEKINNNDPLEQIERADDRQGDEINLDEEDDEILDRIQAPAWEKIKAKKNRQKRLSEMKAMLTLNLANPYESFFEMANLIMNHFKCSVGNKDVRFTELEFYLKCNSHSDHSVHCDSLQLEYGKWYFHRSSKTHKIKVANRKGVDLTFGDIKEKIYGGILIRAFQYCSSEKYVYGPSKVVDEILELTYISSLKELQGTSVFDNPIFRIVPEYLPNMQVYSGPRVHINTKNNGYNDDPYRFYIMPLLEHTDKEKYLMPSLIKQGYSKEEVMKVFGRKTLNL